MKKILFVSTLVSIFSLFSFIPSLALTTELTSETDAEKIYTIFASPPQDSSAMKLRVTVSGGTIKDIENPNSEELTFLPVCQNGGYMDGQDICIDIAVANSIFGENQEVLKVTVETSSEQEVVFSPGEDLAYLTTNLEIVKENGEVIESSTPVSQTQEPAPVSEEGTTNDANYLPFVLLLGILVVLVGAFLAIIFFSDKDTNR